MQIKFASLGLVATVLLSVVDASHLAIKANNDAADVVSPKYTFFACRRLVLGGSKDGNKGLQLGRRRLFGDDDKKNDYKGLQIGRRSFISGSQKGKKTVDSIYRRRQVSDEETGEATEGDKEEGIAEEVEEREIEFADEEEFTGEKFERRFFISDNEKDDKTVDGIFYRRSQDVDEAAGKAPEGDKEEGLEEVEEEELERRSFIGGNPLDQEETEFESVEPKSFITDNEKNGKNFDSVYRRSQYVKGDKGKGLEEIMENTEN